MSDKLNIEPLTHLEKLSGVVISQIFNRLLAGNGFFESPQQTHSFNYHKLTDKQVSQLDNSKMVNSDGLPNERPSHWHRLPWLHAPVFGGWRNYVVISPVEVKIDWYVGWVTPNLAGVSRIKINGPVRLLVGDLQTKWFGISKLGTQIPLQLVGEGEIGKCLVYQGLPLL